MKSIHLLILTALASLVLCLACGAQVIGLHNLKPTPESMPGETSSNFNVEVGNGDVLSAKIERTARGNGTLSIANLSIRVIDDYDDGLIYQHSMLHVEFKDLSGRGYKDLVVTGIAIQTGEKESDARRYIAITSIFMYEPKSKTFVQAFHSGPSLFP